VKDKIVVILRWENINRIIKIGKDQPENLVKAIQVGPE
jgi:hypothetical protein